jgi:uncharacterized protein (TIGR00369 family)
MRWSPTTGQPERSDRHPRRLQGELVATLIDIAAGRLAGRHVGPGQDVTTADMNVHFLAPVVLGPARAEATIVRAGKRLIVTAVDVTDVGRGATDYIFKP